ncbi:ankyrin repeat domain-containing protein [Sphingomonas sp. 28-63-12]|uniref:ankyrin repeat domain-containing protein n=1 Tax=Sphingomonas sp. 28-63-12 TaxID=1970434 RepID=UPI0035A84E41
MKMMIRLAAIAVLAMMGSAMVGSPAAAQFAQSAGAKFLEAVKEEKNNDVVAALSASGTTVVNTRDFSTRETALHIVAKRGDLLYTRFLLQKGADPNLRDAKGNTALMVAVSGGFGDLIAPLVAAKTNVNQGNDSGETPLIRAVQRRDVAMIRELLTAGADPDQADSLAGKSARIYANEDERTPALARLFADIPKRDRRAVAGPTL